MPSKSLGASFRDPSGYVYKDASGTLLRYVSKKYKREYDHLMDSGLYERLTKLGLLIPHKDVTSSKRPDTDCYKIIKPEEVGFISYPYEWSFSQLKDAALTTLKIQQLALEHGMILKDASAYNIQFYNGQPVFIDTLSFDIYKDGAPWEGYRQFCQHFLGPLTLAAYVDINLFKLMRDFIDGIPLEMTSELLPLKTKLLPQLAIHLHLHAKSQKRYADSTKSKPAKQPKVSSRSLTSMVKSLDNVISGLKWKPAGTEWGDYYTFTNYNNAAFKNKANLVKSFLSTTNAKSVWDLGANNGEFSRLASEQKRNTIAFDIDPAAVEKNYRLCKKNKEANLLPLIQDLTNPSPALGWANQERSSLTERGPADCIMALALIHHLAISNNVPLDKLAEYFASLGKYLIIEFVPKPDSQVQKLLSSRKDIFPNYNEDGFETAFKQHFKLLKKESVKGSKRTLYLLKRK